MSGKKSYMRLLKEAIAEYDTSDTVEVKGPMLDPIIAWDGDGELPTYKDAASVLERYYFNENQEDKIETLEGENFTGKSADRENVTAKKSKEAQQHTEGPGGEEQAGTADAGNIRGMEREKEKDIAKEEVDLSEDEWSDKDVPKKKKYSDEHTNESVDSFLDSLEESLLSEEDEEEGDDDEDEEEGEEEMEEGLELENKIIEKLIGEMEDLEEEDKQTSMPKEKKAKGPEEDTHGAGTEQAGTGPDEGQIPSRKDMHDQMVKPKKYTDEHVKEADEFLEALSRELSEQDEEPAPDGEMDELDVDEEVAEQSAVPGGPSPHKAGPEAEDWEEGRYYEESEDVFQLFREAIEEDEDIDEIDPDDIRV